ncbi:MAG: hypothetical protein KFF73_04930 [Cyclobacteriaceae bacterium]|nr:hypothetical protein [Cyclobacteriaceae bacterium]
MSKYQESNDKFREVEENQSLKIDLLLDGASGFGTVVSRETEEQPWMSRIRN